MPNSTKQHQQLTVLIPRELYDKAKDTATAEYLTLAQLVRRLLHEYTTSNGQ